LVLVILAVMWILVLVPPLLRSRSDGRPNTSISSFQQQLRTLQRTGGQPSRGSVTYLRSSSMQGYPPRRTAAPQYDPRYDRYEEYDDGYRDPYGRPQGYRNTAPARRPAVRRSAAYAAAQREAMRRRRQNVLLILAGSTFVTAVLAFGMNMPKLRWVFVASLAALVLYVIVLVQLRRAAELRSYRSSWSRMAA
jgi:hypothetical protein